MSTKKDCKTKSEKTTPAHCAPKAHFILQQAVAALREMTRLKGERETKLQSYVSKPTDSKLDLSAIDSAIAAQQQLMTVAKQALASLYGKKPVPFIIPVSVDMQNTGTTAVLSAPFTIDVTQTAEWSALSALFDEYRFVKGHYDYYVSAPTLATVVGTSSVAATSMFAIGYDPVSSTASTNTRNVCELMQHQLLAPTVRPTSVAGTYIGVYNGGPQNQPKRFEFNTQAVAAMNSSSGANIYPGQWKSTAVAVADGYLKPYYVNGNAASAAIAATGMLYYHVELRSRAD